MIGLKSLIASDDTQEKDIVDAMIKEQVPHHPMDSGGVFGRNYQRNANIDFSKLPESHFYIEKINGNYYLNWYHNLYHFIINALNYNSRITKSFYLWLDAIWESDYEGKLYIPEQYDSERRLTNLYENSLNTAYVFVRYIEPHIRSIDIESVDNNLIALISDMLLSNNDYSDECYFDSYESSFGSDTLVNQMIKYVKFEGHDEDIIAISVHGGSDLRGGYGSVVFFSEYTDYMFANDCSGSISCNNTNCDATWYTDNGGYTIDPSVFNGKDGAENFKEYELSDYFVPTNDKNNYGHMRCPVCRTGILEGHLY